MLGHIEEIDCDCWTVQVLYFLYSDHRVVCNILWHLRVFRFRFISIRAQSLYFIDLAFLLVQIFFCYVDYTIYDTIKTKLWLINLSVL